MHVTASIGKNNVTLTSSAEVQTTLEFWPAQSCVVHNQWLRLWQ
jgi:hypothetical protein